MVMIKGIMIVVQMLKYERALLKEGKVCQRMAMVFPLGRWILFSVMALIPLAMSVLTVISLNPVTKNHYNRY